MIGKKRSWKVAMIRIRKSFRDFRILVITSDHTGPSLPHPCPASVKALDTATAIVYHVPAERSRRG